MQYQEHGTSMVFTEILTKLYYFLLIKGLYQTGYKILHP